MSWEDKSYPFIEIEYRLCICIVGILNNTLGTWDENDFRLFVGNLGKETSTEMLANIFRQRYPSFLKARVVEDKVWKGSKGYGFVSFSDPLEGVKAMNEMNGKLCGNRPMQIKKSNWKDKNEKEISFLQYFL